MEAKKLQVKFFLEHKSVKLEEIVPVFHAWIREHKLGSEMLVDVADYAHVQDGPGVVLIGDASDYYLDLGDGRPGLLYSRKRHAVEDSVARVEDALRRALSACRLLEDEKLSVPFRFRTDEVLFRLNERLSAENTEAGFAKVRPVLEKAFTKLYGGQAPAFTRQGTERELLTVKVSAPGAAELKTLLERVGGPLS